MGIRFLCESCEKKLNIKEELAGKKGRCPKCNAVIKIPKQSTLGDTKTSKSEPSANLQAEPEQVVVTTATDDSKRKRNKAAAKTTANKNTTGTTTATNEQPVAEAGDTGPPPVPNIQDSDAGITFVGDQSPAPSSEDSESNLSAGSSSLKAMENVLDENPEAKWFVRPGSGGQFGPAESSVMKNWLDEGRIGPDSLVWCEGWEDWQSASDVFVKELGSGKLPPELKEPAQSEQAPKMDSGAMTNRTYSHMQARQRARMMGVVLIVGLALVSIALAVVLVIVVNNAAKQSDSKKKDDQEASLSVDLGEVRLIRS